MKRLYQHRNEHIIMSARSAHRFSIHLDIAALCFLGLLLSGVSAARIPGVSNSSSRAYQVIAGVTGADLPQQSLVVLAVSGNIAVTRPNSGIPNQVSHKTGGAKGPASEIARLGQVSLLSAFHFHTTLSKPAVADRQNFIFQCYQNAALPVRAGPFRV